MKSEYKGRLTWFETLDVLLDCIIGTSAWVYGVYTFFATDNVERAMLAFVLAFVVEHVVGSKLQRKGVP